MKAKKKSKAALKASKKAFKAELTKHVKAAKVKTKKVEINRHATYMDTTFSYGRPGAETWATGYARPFTAKRGAERHFKDFIAKGGRLEFIKNY